MPRFDDPPRSDAPPPPGPEAAAPPSPAPHAAPTGPAPGPLTTSPFGLADEAAYGPSGEPGPSAPAEPPPFADPVRDTEPARADPRPAAAGTPQGPPPPAPAYGPPPAEPPPGPRPAPRSGPSGPGTWTKAFAKLPVPLLPIVALVVAVGVVAYALSTQQISLNFAGGAPKEPSTGAKDSQVSQRGPKERSSRGAHRPDGLVVAFRRTSSTATGFRATVTIANRGRQPVPLWALAFTIPNSSVRAVSGATVVKTGRLAHVRSKPGAAPLAPGQSLRIAFAATGKAAGPSSCVLNRLPCARV